MPLYSIHIPELKEGMNAEITNRGYAEVITAYAKKNTYYAAADTPRTAFCSVLNRILPKDRKGVVKELNELYFGEAPDTVPDFMKVVENGGLSD